MAVASLHRTLDQELTALLRGPRERSLFALHRTGFGEPPCRHDAGGLLPHPFTLT